VAGTGGAGSTSWAEVPAERLALVDITATEVKDDPWELFARLRLALAVVFPAAYAWRRRRRAQA
jgi:hypothetical protein